MKHCNRCDKDREITDFWRAKLGKDGIDWYCKFCRKELQKETLARPVHVRKGGTGRPARVVQEGMRYCGGCKTELPILCFTGAETTCKPCKQERHYKRTYGITRQDTHEAIKSQGGLCAICKIREPIYIDHCHKTGKFRGVLCQQCNTGLGYFFDDVEVLKRAMEYVSDITAKE